MSPRVAARHCIAARNIAARVVSMWVLRLSMESVHDPATDPRADECIPSVFVPVVVGEVRLAASEVRCSAEMIGRMAGGELAGHARLLASLAIRLGQASTMLSAVPIPAPTPEPPPLRGWARWRAAWVMIRTGR